MKKYVSKNLAPAWAEKYCYENYELSCDDFIGVVVINFSPACHSSEGLKWEYEKKPTCVEGGISVLKCRKCGKVIQRNEEKPTGKCDTYWVYDNEKPDILNVRIVTLEDMIYMHMVRFGDTSMIQQRQICLRR